MSAFNGSGVFVISGVGLPYVTGTTISSTVGNQLNNDIAAGLSNCMTRDGQAPPVANIPMGGFKFTGLGAPTAPGDALVFGQPVTVSSPFQITNNQNALTYAQITNTDPGGAARTAWRANNGGAIIDFGMYGTGFTTAGIAQANRGYISSSGDLALFTNAAVPILFGINSAERMRLDTQGNLGLGVIPPAWGVGVVRALSIGFAGAIWASTGSGAMTMGYNIYYDGANARYVGSDSASYVSCNGTGSQAVNFNYAGAGAPNAVASTKTGAFMDFTGTFVHLGPTTGTGYSALFQNGLGNTDVFIEQQNGTAPAIAGTMRVSRNAGNNRSINAIGTINANGTDYAEYEVKDPACGAILPGQIVGFTATGQITDLWASAVSFGVKSTDPSFVGGDAWATSMPPRPEPNGMVEGPAKDAEEAALAQWFIDLDALRQTVDRIAYCGKVPVNVLGAAPGDYIIAVQNGAGIDGQIVAVPTLAQLQNCVGRVRSILLDGRAQISVMMN